jgi:hypothetical protein
VGSQHCVGEAVNLLYRCGPGDPAVSELCDTADGCVGRASEQNRNLHWRGTNGGAIDDRLALPGMAHERHFVVQKASAGVEVHTGSDEVVFAATAGEPDWEVRLPHERHRRQRYSV